MHRNLGSIHFILISGYDDSTKSIKFLATLAIMLVSVVALAADTKSQGGNPIDTDEEILDYILHHIQDSHDFIFFTDGETGKHYGFSLPVILVDNGLQVFMSSKFHYGETIAESNGNYYKLYHWENL